MKTKIIKGWAVVNDKGKILDVAKDKKGSRFCDDPLEFFGADKVPVEIKIVNPMKRSVNKKKEQNNVWK